MTGPLKHLLILLFTASLFPGCSGNSSKSEARNDSVETIGTGSDSVVANEKKRTEEVPKLINDRYINTGSVHPDSLLHFARTLKGIPYLYASTDPAKGFDCSGFITYVFNHFNIAVPRSSVDFTNIEKEIDVKEAGRGDIILFTGTDSTIRVVGHMGIVEGIRNDSLYFIHSTSGKMKGVVISSLGNYYRSRFVKTIRIFPDEFFE